jgi:hypothetical protein
MALGIEQNSIAPSLIQSSGQALVQGIRQIGQQISGHLTEMQTKRDLAAMAQDLQGINPQSTEFPVQLTQLVSRHPMAVRDERGQMALSVLGKAHGAWQASQSDALAFQRQMEMQGLRSQASSAAAAAADQRKASRTKVGNKIVDLTDPENPVTVFEGDPLNPPMPFTSTPQGVMDRRTGQITSPAPDKQMTPYQREQLNRMGKRDRISAINREIDQFDQDIRSAEKAYENSFKRETEASEPADKTRYQAEKTEMGRIADQLKAEKKKRMEMLRQIDSAPEEKVDITAVVEPELGVLPPDAAAPSVLPPAGAVTPTPASTEMIMVIDPNGRPGRIRASQLDAALQNGYRRR